MVRGCFACPMQNRDFSLVFQYPYDNYASLDSQIRKLYNDLRYANVGNKIEFYSTWEFGNFNFQYLFLNWIISVIDRAKVTKFGTPLAEGHSGTVSQIFNLGPSFYFMKSRKLSCKKW